MSDLGEYLRLLADETRLRILHLLEHEPLTVAELQDVLELGQSSISGHLAKLKQTGLIHDLAEGSARRYRLREDLDGVLRGAWQAVRGLSLADLRHDADRQRLIASRRDGAASWVERVAGCLNRSYAPGRTWESLAHGMVQFARFGRCVDIGAGDGAMLDFIAPRATSLDCVEPSAAMLRAGEARVAELKLDHVRWHQARGEELPLPDASRDSVLFLHSLQYLDDPARALAEAERVLAPGGRLLVLTLAKHEHGEEAAAFGHRHLGFGLDQLKRWTRGAGEARGYELPPEAKAPRFQALVFTAVKADARKGRRGE